MQQQINGSHRNGILNGLTQILVGSCRFTIGCIRVLARYGTSPQTVAAYGVDLTRTIRGSAWSRPAARIALLPPSDSRRLS